MPEGDTVHRLAERMAGLEGRLITSTDFRVPRLATASLTGRRIERVWAWGKNLYWDCAGDADTLVLYTHLRMDGIWNIHAAGTRWRSPGHTARVVIRVAGHPDPAREVELVGHELGKVELWPAAEYP
ncbi:MAG: DNA-formamidopyrimidine glycosylase family protein, partial [Arachnia sp.]